MRSKAKREIESMAEEVIAKLDARLRRPLNEMSSFFEWLRRLKFNSESNERLVAAALSDEMPKFEAKIFSETDVAALSIVLSTYRRQISEMAKSRELKGNA